MTHTCSFCGLPHAAHPDTDVIESDIARASICGECLQVAGRLIVKHRREQGWAMPRLAMVRGRDAA